MRINVRGMMRASTLFPIAGHAVLFTTVITQKIIVHSSSPLFLA